MHAFQIGYAASMSEWSGGVPCFKIKMNWTGTCMIKSWKQWLMYTKDKQVPGWCHPCMGWNLSIGTHSLRDDSYSRTSSAGSRPRAAASCAFRSSLSIKSVCSCTRASDADVNALRTVPNSFLPIGDATTYLQCWDTSFEQFHPCCCTVSLLIIQLRRFGLSSETACCPHAGGVV